MSRFRLAGDQRVLLTHLALYGLSAILDEAGVNRLTLRWEAGTPCLDAPDLESFHVGEVVRAHAAARTGSASWVTSDAVLEGSTRGRMSPRLTVFKNEATWQELQDRRHEVLDGLTDDRSWLDLRMLAALGQPCYWSRTPKGEPLQDDGASRWEMQPRNRGSEIVTNRLRPLALAVSRRTSAAVVAGLDGSVPNDELGKGAADSVTATGLAVPGPVDNATAWCALWGISAMPLAPRINRTAVTSSHLGRPREEWFYAPVWSTAWRPSRLRTMLASAQLRTAAGADLPRWSEGSAREMAAGAWLRTRGVLGVVRFEIGRFGSDNAPERRALHGEALSLGGAR